MIRLKPIDFMEVNGFFVDFQKKSKCFELPPDDAKFLGIHLDNKLIGYYVLKSYNDGTLEINQGYLLKAYRHMDLAPLAMECLEHEARRCKYKQIAFATGSRFRSYLKFGKRVGYKPSKLIFLKRL